MAFEFLVDQEKQGDVGEIMVLSPEAIRISCANLQDPAKTSFTRRTVEFDVVVLEHGKVKCVQHVNARYFIVLTPAEVR